MIIGKIFKDPEPGKGAPPWAVEVEAFGGWTQGRTLKDAIAMLVDLVRCKLEHELKRPDVTSSVTVTVIGNDAPDSYQVLVEASEPALLAALVLRYQRQVRGLTLAQVAEKLGASYHNAYASYEQGKREPSISKMRELLAAVAPEMALTIGPRKPPKSAAPAAPHRARRKTATARRRTGG